MHVREVLVQYSLVALEKLVQRLEQAARGEELHALRCDLDQVVVHAAAELRGDLVEERGPVVDRRADCLQLDVRMLLLELREQLVVALLLLGGPEIHERERAAAVAAATAAARRDCPEPGQSEGAGRRVAEETAPRERPIPPARRHAAIDMIRHGLISSSLPKRDKPRAAKDASMR